MKNNKIMNRETKVIFNSHNHCARSVSICLFFCLLFRPRLLYAFVWLAAAAAGKLFTHFNDRFKQTEIH